MILILQMQQIVVVTGLRMDKKVLGSIANPIQCSASMILRRNK